MKHIMEVKIVAKFKKLFFYKGDVIFTRSSYTLISLEATLNLFLESVVFVN